MIFEYILELSQLYVIRQQQRRSRSYSKQEPLGCHKLIGCWQKAKAEKKCRDTITHSDFHEQT